MNDGHYIAVGAGFGFFVSERDFRDLQDLANALGKVQFLGVTRDGQSLFGTREEILEHPDS
ncbi:MAG TPA: hypothetical protein VKB78_15525, partial [Pirellulales bacterium]|nr:hypothetical protein [Pirellulales bacterium]